MLQKRKKHHITSFQLFANSVRGEIQRDNKGASFGEISQLIAAKVSTRLSLYVFDQENVRLVMKFMTEMVKS